MALITPFRALRYSTDRVPNLAEVVAPPYDVIDAQAQEALYARSPYNCVHLILARGEDRYARAAADLEAWRREGVLVQDADPGFYIVEDRYRVRGGVAGDTELRRLGLVCLARIESPDAGVILPHERTMAAPREDRLRLMRAVDAQLSQILMLTPDRDGRFESLCEKALGEEVLAEFDGVQGAHHRLARVISPALLAEFQETLRDRPLLIADGHHRYETARAYRDARRAEAPGDREGSKPYDHVMVLIASMDDPGTSVLGYHRIVRETGVESGALRERLGKAFALEKVVGSDGAAAHAALLEAMDSARDSGCAAFGLALKGEENFYLLKRKRDASAPIREQLDVAVLHGEIFGKILGMTEKDFTEQRRIDYTADPERALSLVGGGTHAAAFLLNPTPPAEVLAVAQEGHVMPQKSTYFYPKLLTGLTFHLMGTDTL